MSALPATAAATFTEGWLVSAGLIAAIGAQNALVLRQGLARRHVGPVVALCAGADALLIALGVFGLGAAIVASPIALETFRWGGAAFLACYGALALRRAVRGGAHTLSAAAPRGGLGATLTATLALTFLNPHVYLDTVLLLGSLGARHGDSRAAFALGAATASVMWFLTLGYGAAAAAPWLARTAVWRAIDAAVAALMFLIAARLLLTPLST